MALRRKPSSIITTPEDLEAKESTVKSTAEICSQALAKQLQPINELFTLDYCKNLIDRAFKNIASTHKKFNSQNLGNPTNIKIQQIPHIKNIEVRIAFPNNKVIKFSLIHCRKANINQGQKPQSVDEITFSDTYEVRFAKTLDLNIATANEQISNSVLARLEE